MGTVGDVCKSIQAFRRLGRYIEGDVYIVGLSSELRQDKVVVIEVAQLYLTQGHYIKAWDACHLVSCPIFKNGDPTAEFTLEIRDASSVTLALLTSYVGICRYGKLKTALRYADRVYDVWLTPNLDVAWSRIQDIVPVEARDNFLNTAKSIRAAFQASTVDTKLQHTIVSEHQLLLEFYYHKIRVVAAEQGLLEEHSTKKNATDRLDVLRAWTTAKGRLQEARYLTYFRIDLANDNTEDLKILRAFLQVLEGTDYLIETAQTHLDFARCLLKSGDPVLEDEGQHHINKAEELFKNQGHVFGLIDLMDMQLSEKKTIPLKDVLAWKLSFADIYFGKACYQQGIRCLIFTVPVSTDMGDIFQKTQLIIERARSEIANVGGVILEQALFVNAVAQSLVRAPEYGYVRQILEEYLDHLPDEAGPKLLGSLHQSLRLAYTNIGEFDKALSYAERALIVSLEGATYTEISDAAFILAVSKTDRGRRLPNGSPLTRLWHSNTITFLSGWISLDRFMGYHQQEVDKCCWLASVEATMAHMLEDEEAFKRSDQWLYTARESCNSYKITAKQLMELEIARATRVHDFDLAVTLASDRLRSLQSDSLTTPFDLAQATIAASMTTYQRYCWRLQLAAGQSKEGRGAATGDLVEALKLASQAFDLYSASGGSEMIVTALNWMYDLIRHFPSEGFRDLMSHFLVEAEKIEAFCDAVRRSSASTRGPSSLLEKRNLVSGYQFRNLYSNAIEICMDLGELPAAWLWIQKGKARALSDLFGSRALIPPSLLNTIASDEDARELYEKDRLATEAALKNGPLDYLNARREAESIRAEMRKHPQLSQILDIREGSFNVDFYESELTNVIEFSNMDPKSVKYVEWFISSSRGQKDKIVRLIRQVDGVTSSQVLTITRSFVERWKNRIFDFPAEAEPPLRREGARGRLRELAALVAGLEQSTNDGDMLVLSPSGILNGIPLHALPLGGRSLIERNLVIYSSSAALFRHCHIRAASQSSQAYEHARKAAFLAVYESSTPEQEAEQSQIYSHAQRISKENFPFKLHTGSAVTKSLFEQTAQTSSWIHYHGHALFDKHDPLRSCLVLHSPPTSNEAPLTPPVPPTTNLTVSSIFSVPMLTTAPHFTIIACDSGSQDIAPGDEPLGLVSALLYAGGASVLGTLWPVDSRTARTFTELFYDDLRQQVETLSRVVPAGQRFVVLNLAAALRNAVIKMMNRSSLETRAPLHWAGYVLHGAWFHVHPLTI